MSLDLPTVCSMYCTIQYIRPWVPRATLPLVLYLMHIQSSEATFGGFQKIFSYSKKVPNVCM